MSADKIEVSLYAEADRSELLRLLYELHIDYYFQNSTPQIQEVDAEYNIRASQERYMKSVEQLLGTTWQIFVARNQNGLLGFITGSIKSNTELILSPVGRIEDWYVIKPHRKYGVGLRLYNDLVVWFKQNGGKQIQSETLGGNELSAVVHQRLGFFVSEICLAKKL